MTTETYISEKEIQSKFRVGQSYKPNFGIFYATRYLYSIDAVGGKTWQRCLFYLVFNFALTPLSLALDLSGAALYGAILLIKRIAEGLFLATISIIKSAFTKFLNTTLTIAAVLIVALAIYYRWSDITYYVHKLLYYKFF